MESGKIMWKIAHKKRKLIKFLVVSRKKNVKCTLENELNSLFFTHSSCPLREHFYGYSAMFQLEVYCLTFLELEKKSMKIFAVRNLKIAPSSQLSSCCKKNS